MNRIILLLLFLTSAVFAENVYFELASEIEVELYYRIFNAMAMNFNDSDTYAYILKLVFVVSGFFVFAWGTIKGATNSDGSVGLKDLTKYTLGGVAMLSLVFSSSTTVVLETQNITTYCSKVQESNNNHNGHVIDNVPYLPAWVMSAAIKAGNETTKLARTTFTAPGDVVPEALRGISSAGDVLLNDITIYGSSANSEMSTSLSKLMEKMYVDCFLTPAGKGGEHSDQVKSLLVKSGNPLKSLDEFMLNNRLVIYKNPLSDSNETVITEYVLLNDINSTKMVSDATYTELSESDALTCKQLYTNYFKPEIEKLRNNDELECHNTLKDSFNPHTMTMLTGGEQNMPISTAKNIAINAGFINHWKSINAAKGTELFSYEKGKSQAEFVMMNQSGGTYMAKILPYLQAGIRALIYGLFPFVFIVALTPGGMKVLINYFQSIIWVELWMPISAVLDMILYTQSKSKINQIFENDGFNMTGAASIFSDATMISSIAGYLYLSVPALAWLILKGSGHMLGNITASAAATLNKNMDSASVNSDIADMKSNQMINKDRISRGEKIISIAEQDHMNALMTGAENSGTFRGKNEFSDKELSDAKKGSALENTAVGGQKANYSKDEHIKAATGSVTMGMAGATAQSAVVDEYGKEHIEKTLQDSEFETFGGKDGTKERMREKAAAYGIDYDGSPSSIAKVAKHDSIAGNYSGSVNKVKNDTKQKDLVNNGIDANAQASMASTDVKKDIKKGATSFDEYVKTNSKDVNEFKKAQGLENVANEDLTDVQKRNIANMVEGRLEGENQAYNTTKFNETIQTVKKVWGDDAAKDLAVSTAIHDSSRAFVAEAVSLGGTLDSKTTATILAGVNNSHGLMMAGSFIKNVVKKGADKGKMMINTKNLDKFKKNVANRKTELEGLKNKRSSGGTFTKADKKRFDELEKGVKEDSKLLDEMKRFEKSGMDGDDYKEFVKRVVGNYK
jgi:hypothetical protein